MTSIFTSERQALAQRVSHNRKVVYGLAGTAVACLLAPILFDGMLPRPLKTGLLGTATAGLLGAAMISQHTQVGEDMMSSLRTADKEHLKRHFAHKAAVAEQEQMIASRADLLKRILYSQQPIRWQWEAAKQCGIENDWKAVALEWGWVPYNVLYPPAQQHQGRSPSTAMVQGQVEALPVTYQEQLPVLDIPSAIAGYDGHLLVASRTGSGKTTLIQGAIAAKHAKHDGLIDFHIFDPKGASWLGLEHDADYLFCNNFSKVLELLHRLRVIERALEARQQQRIEQGGHWTTPPMPMVIILDEFNTLKSLCDKKQKPELKRLVERIIFQGREDNVHLWLMAQTTRVEQLNLDTSVQDNLMYVAMARNGDYQSVEDAVGNKYVVGNSDERKALWELLMADKHSNRSKGQPIAFTTLQGNQLCLLPDLSQAKHIRLQVRVMNQGTSSEVEGLRQQLERRFQLDLNPDLASDPEPIDGEVVDDSDPIDYSHIPKILQPIVEYAIKKKGEWITAREVRSNVRFYKDGGHSTDQIRVFFQQITSYGVGTVDGEGERLKYRV